MVVSLLFSEWKNEIVFPRTSPAILNVAAVIGLNKRLPAALAIMKPERWVELEKLYQEVVDLDPDGRDQRLSAIPDLDLRREVLSLIQAGPLSSDIAAWLKEERGRVLVQHDAPTGPLQDTASTLSRISSISQTFQPGDLLAERYRIVKLLGQGGMGEVYEAQDQDLRERIALKVIGSQAGMDQAWVERFRREVQLARRVTHPNVCRVFDLDRHRQGNREILFLTMELVQGETLAARLKRAGRLSVADALPIAVQLCAALQAAHQAGVLHRDFKCGNVMLDGSGEQVRAVVTDFGTALPMDSRQSFIHTATSAIVGTPAYMSPEQLEGRDLTPASDIYSLGLVLYEMVTGARPFHDQSHWVEAMRRLTENPESPSRIASDIGRNWNSTILRCLERLPAKRFPSAVEVEQSLQEPGLSHRLHPGRLAWAVAALVILAVAAAVAFRAHLFLPSLPATKHIAVLSFTFAGDDPANRAMASELAESLTGNLAHLQTSDGRVWVVPWKVVQERPSSDEKHAASALGVNLLLTGEVIKLNDGLRLHAHLLDANSLKELRSAVVQVSSEKILTFEDSLLARVCAMLQLELPQGVLHLAAADETKEPGAYEFYAQGHGYMLRREATNMDRAIALFQKAIQKDPHFALAYADLGSAYAWKFFFSHEKSWLDQATQACAQALALNNKLAQAHLACGTIQRHTGHLEQAIAEYQQALQLDPGNDDARDFLSAAYDRAGRVLDAETLLKDSLNRNPANWVAYDSLGVFYYGHANYTQAEPLFRSAAELAPDNPIAFNHLGAIYYSLDRFKEAEDMFRKSVAIQPTAAAYTNLGLALRQQQRYAESAVVQEKAVELTPSNSVMWYNLGSTYDLLHDQQKSTQAYEKAVETAEKELAINPANSEVLEKLAMYSAVLGQKEKALRYLARVTGPLATTPDTLFDSAEIYAMAGKPEMALKNIRAALLAGVSLSRIQNSDPLASLRTDKRYLEIINSQAAVAAH